MDFVITSEEILYLCGFIAAVWGVWKIIKEVRKPNEDFKTLVKEHEEKIKEDENRLKEYEDTNQMVLKCLLAIINHEITGNGVDRMKKLRDDLNDFLIDK